MAELACGPNQHDQITRFLFSPTTEFKQKTKLANYFFENARPGLAYNLATGTTLAALFLSCCTATLTMSFTISLAERTESMEPATWPIRYGRDWSMYSAGSWPLFFFLISSASQ